MRNMSDFLRSVDSLESKKDNLGDDYESTLELRNDVVDYVDFSKGGYFNRDVENQVRHKLARGMAYAEYNGEYMTFAMLQKERQVGEGELLAQRTREFDSDLMNGYGQSEMIRRLSVIVDREDQSHPFVPDHEAYYRGSKAAQELNEEEAMRQWQQSVLDEYESDMKSQNKGHEREVYDRILEEENIARGTKPDDLPYYVVKRMHQNGLDVDNMDFDDKPLSRNAGCATMNTGNARKSSIPGRIYGDGLNPRRRGYGDYDTSQNGSLVDEYGENQDNGFNFDEYD